jgi:hypothetical protein
MPHGRLQLLLLVLLLMQLQVGGVSLHLIRARYQQAAALLLAAQLALDAHGSAAIVVELVTSNL